VHLRKCKQSRIRVNNQDCVRAAKMRTVSFVDYFELEFEGSVFSKAMLAADVDNDNVSTSVTGNIDPGHTSLFVWNTCKGHFN